MKTFINFLTIFRLLSSVLVFLFIMNPDHYKFALIIFIFASYTDYLDGYLARKYSHESIFGEILDPIADKVLVMFTLFAIAINLASYYIGFISALILSREILVGALRDFNSRTNNSDATKVIFIAKFKTFTQLSTIVLYLFALSINNMIVILFADILLLVTFFITAYTGYIYTLNTFRKTF